MDSDSAHVCVCVCTFKRSEMLRRLLKSLRNLQTDGRFSFSVVVVDNDVHASASPVVEEVIAAGGLRVKYGVEPQQNIALARNKACALAEGDLLAWIDDDEFPAADWLLRLFIACQNEGVGGVLGPVLPHFDEDPPNWVLRGGFYERPRHATGFTVGWREARTGNVLLRRETLDRVDPPFRAVFGNGGEDQDFFHRTIDAGVVWIWCDDAVVFETVPRARWKRGVMLRRALLRGSNTAKHAGGRVSGAIKSVIAVPAYLLVLPFLFLGWHHLFMKYAIKLCDHAGRLLALVNLNPVRSRDG